METRVERLAYSKTEAAEALGLSLRTIDNLIAGKTLTARRIGRRVVIPVTGLQALIRSDRPTRRCRHDDPVEGAGDDQRNDSKAA